MKRFATSIALAALALAWAAPTWASNADAVIALHVKATSTKLQCTTNSPAALVVTSFTTSGDLNIGYHVYIVVAKASTTVGLAGVSTGINYNNTAGQGVDVFAWSKCSDLEFPGQGWPASGGGNTITWDRINNCQRTDVGGLGTQAVGGYFYVTAYSADQFALVNRTIAVPDQKVADCNAAETDLTDLGRSGFVNFSAGAAIQGCNPSLTTCFPVPVEPTTWGKIKQTYGE